MPLGISFTHYKSCKGRYFISTNVFEVNPWQLIMPPSKNTTPPPTKKLTGAEEEANGGSHKNAKFTLHNYVPLLVVVLLQDSHNVK